MHDVQQAGPLRQSLQQIVRILNRTAYSGLIFIIAWHSDHLHIIHDCSYSQSHCRCSRIRELRNLFKRFNRKVLRAGDFTSTYWRNLLAYLSAGCRQILYLAIAGRSWLNHGETRFNADERDRRSREAVLVEESDSQSQLHMPECSFNHPEEGRGANGSHVAADHERPARGKGGKNNRLFEWLLARPTAPLKLLYQNPDWTTSEYKFTVRETGNFKNIEYLVAIHYLNLQTKD